MSRTKRAHIQELRAVNKEPERKLPDTLELTQSQIISLTVLAQSDQEHHKQIETNRLLRIKVLEEVKQRHGVSLEAISQGYQFDGEKLFKPTV